MAAATGGPSVESVGFGTGGTDCSLATTATRFSSADPIRVVAEFSPELSTGTVVKIWLSLDGKVLESSGQSLTLDAPAGCISGPLSDTPLAVGHCRWDISPDTAPAISGGFDVARGLSPDVTHAPSPGPSRASTRATNSLCNTPA